MPSDPEKLAEDADAAWDTTCLLDGTTGQMACSELGFGNAILEGSEADPLSDDDLCGFAPHKC